MGSVQSTVENLVALVLSLQARVDAAEARATTAEARVTALEAENAELRARLGKDSTNSNKPPSSDEVTRINAVPPSSP